MKDDTLLAMSMNCSEKLSPVMTSLAIRPVAPNMASLPMAISKIFSCASKLSSRRGDAGRLTQAGSWRSGSETELWRLLMVAGFPMNGLLLGERAVLNDIGDAATRSKKRHWRVTDGILMLLTTLTQK